MLTSTGGVDEAVALEHNVVNPQMCARRSQTHLSPRRASPTPLEVTRVDERVGDHPQRALGSLPWTVGATPPSTPSDAEELCGTRGGVCGSQREADEPPIKRAD